MRQKILHLPLLTFPFVGLSKLLTYRRTHGQMDRWKDGWMADGWTDGWTGGWMEGWMEGWTDGWMDRWMDRHIESRTEFELSRNLQN